MASFSHSESWWWCHRERKLVLWCGVAMCVCAMKIVDPALIVAHNGPLTAEACSPDS